LGERSICASSALSQSCSGTSGARTRAMMERPRRRINGRVSDVVTLCAYPGARPRSTVLRGKHKIKWKTYRRDTKTSIAPEFGPNTWCTRCSNRHQHARPGGGHPVMSGQVPARRARGCLRHRRWLRTRYLFCLEESGVSRSARVAAIAS
jgi:hypothetical protein